MTESVTVKFDRGKFHSKRSQLVQLMEMVACCKPKKVSELADILDSNSGVVGTILSEIVNMVKLIPSLMLPLPQIYMCMYIGVGLPSTTMYKLMFSSDDTSEKYFTRNWTTCSTPEAEDPWRHVPPRV